MEEDLKLQENLKNMERFFECDLEIKNMLMKVAPKEMYANSEESRIEYSDMMFDNMKDMEDRILEIINLFDFNKTIQEVAKAKVHEIREKLINSGYSFSELKDIYKQCFSNMSKDLIKEVKENCYGYCLDRDLGMLIEHSNSINELLHVLHSYITNSEYILQNMPILEQKTSSYGENYTIYGTENDIARQIYDNIDNENTQLGITDIIALKDKVLMMVRDSGHALTLEIDKEGDSTFVKYFIPKICNAKLVNQLKGVIKVDINAKANESTQGEFKIEGKNIGEEIISFIEQVPTDSDMEIWFENQNREQREGVIREEEIETNEEDLSLQQVNEKEEIRWMSILKNCYETIEKAPETIKNKLIKLKSDIITSIKGIIKNEQTIDKKETKEEER